MATEFQITRTDHGYAHQRFDGIAPPEMPASEIAARCNDAAEYFGWREFRREGEKFFVTVHID